MNAKTLPTLLEAVRERTDSLVALRRDFHRHPELSFAEHRTAEVIAERLRAAGCEVRTGIAGTGVVGVLHGDKPGRTVAWRADIDALPIEETLDLPFRSVNAGAMHACGHDGHAAVALTLADILAARRRELTGTAVFIFQPAEEVFGGAKPMIEAGVLEQPHVEQVYGLHLSTMYPAGQVAAFTGPSMASADFFDMEVRGKGGHGAFPHLSVDPITAAAHILVGMQDLVSREVPARDAAVMTVGEIKAGSKHNIIPEVATMRGSLRCFEARVRDQLIERLAGFARHIAQAYRADAAMRLVGDSCPAVVNPAEETAFVHRCFHEAVPEECVAEGQPVMGSDDMSLFLQERPGCYFWVGVGPGDKEPMPHHHPGFEMDEAGLPVAVQVALTVMTNALGA